MVAQRFFDILLGMVLLAIAFPVVLVAMLAVRLTSRGPAIYTQIRSGRFGEPFRIFKIRTMFHNCERTSGVQWSGKLDNRVTIVGRILRKTHIDELPQLINVLRGDMSLVGPRPERPEIITSLDPAIPRYRARLAVRPGLTGLAQVQLPPDTDIESVKRKLKYDLHYVAVGCVWMDVRLIIATAVHVSGLPFALSRMVLNLPGQTEVEAERSRLQVHVQRESAIDTPLDAAGATVHPDAAVEAARA
jgi:lipopolysaccharide/colanic/teichoic acid biosynthesis glycosyltransferase